MVMKRAAQVTGLVLLCVLAYMRIVTYNPQIARQERLEEILGYFDGKADVVVLTGTKMPADGGNDPVRLCRLGRWTVYCFGYKLRSQHHAGLAIAVRNKFGKELSVVGYYGPPARLASVRGRVGAIRCRSNVSDITIVGLYLPPYSSPSNKNIYHKSLQFMDNFLSSIPARSTPVICMDANARVGLQAQDGGWQSGLSPAVGTVGTLLPENAAGTALRLAMEKQYLCLANTVVGSGSDTYYSSRTSTRIDYIAVPQTAAAAGRIRTINTLLDDVMYLQNKPSFHPRDHVPVYMDIDLVLGYTAKKENVVQWDRTKLVDACVGKLNVMAGLSSGMCS
eukprot:TRINITY_DN18681_c0_g1_i3.p1 TRINITY_DN18681_c0_g1~~TRINITY_DN18681_c0_g1_i3.p1  ORF type:complete len:336 (-),score=68.56 TRINITY_DN18681_c0_g1_i3:379-1386(-)